MRKVLITIPVEERHKEYFENIGKDCAFEYVQSSEVSREQVRDASIIIGNVPAEMLPAAEKLEWLQLNSAGADLYCKPGILKSGTLLTNATGAYGLAISEFMVGAALMLLKKLNLYYDNQKKHLWKDEGGVTSIWGSTTLVIGLGDIGGEFAKRMKALGSHTIGIRRKPGDKPDYLDELYTNDKMDELIPRADFISLSLPNTPETYRIINEDRLRSMKKGAYLINVGRGTAIDTDALCRVLNDGHLGGCALDVTDPEPLPSDHPLWDAGNVIITPHISGHYHLQETLERIIRISGSNLEKFLNGTRMDNLVNFETGYRERQN